MRTRKLLGTALFACTAASAHAQDAAAVSGRWAEAFAAGDIAQAIALYDQNATFVGLGSREVGRDREAARSYLSNVFSSTSKREVTCNSPIVRPRGDVTVVASVCQFNIAFKDGRMLNNPVRYHMVVQKSAAGLLITDHHLSLTPGK